MQLGEFETFQVEETQLLGSWYSIIWKLESIPVHVHPGQGSSRSQEGSICSALGWGWLLARASPGGASRLSVVLLSGKSGGILPFFKVNEHM